MYISVQRVQGECRIDVDMQGEAHGITALYGPSGAGKTSIINMVAGLLAPDSGRIVIGGHCVFDSERGINLPPEKRHTGYVFQEGRLFPHLCVTANLLYGQRRHRAGEPAAAFDDVTRLLGIRHLLHRKPRTLSGGEKQRIALGRALLSAPRVLLMDEPLASLDTARKKELLPFIKELNAVFHIPVLYVSHSLEEIQALTNRVVTLVEGRMR